MGPIRKHAAEFLWALMAQDVGLCEWQKNTVCTTSAAAL